MTRVSPAWHIAVVGLCTAGAVVLFLTAADGGHLAIGLVGLAIIVAAWFLVGRTAVRERAGWTVVALHIGVIAGSTLAAAGSPNLAAIQGISFPLLWATAPTRRGAISASALLALGVGLGYALGAGGDPPWLVSGAIVTTLSFGFAVVMGLWFSAITDESEARRALVAELEAAQAQLAVASRDAGVTVERERFAREIHDTVAQDLAGLVMGLRRLAAGIDDGGLRGELGRLTETAESALAEARALVAANSSPSIEDGTAAALERLAERYRRETGLAVEVAADESLPTIPRENEVVLVRVAQESLANVRKHANASAVSVALEHTPGVGVRLRIADDGAGFDPDAVTGGFGIEGMRERLTLAGGTLDVATGPNGTTMTATVPITAAVPTEGEA